MKLIASFAALLGITFSAPSAAQNNAALPPDSVVTSPGGVDAVSGQYRDTTTELAVGPEAAGGIKLNRISQGWKPWKSNWHIFTVFRGQFSRDDSGLGIRVGENLSIDGGGVSRNWAYDGGHFIDYTATYGPSKLEIVGSGSSSHHVYTAPGGVVYTFSPATNSGQAQISAATKIQHPNGVVYELTYSGTTAQYLGGLSYDVPRLTSVRSNTGYVLNFTYDGTGRIGAACAFSSAIVTPSSSCPAGSQSVSYTYAAASGTNAYVVASVTDNSGAVSTISTNVSAGVGTQIFYKPGLSGAYLTNTSTVVNGSVPNRVVTGQQFFDGRSISYSYTDLADNVFPDPPILAGGTSRVSGWTENGNATTGLSWQWRSDVNQRLSIAPTPDVSDPLGRSTSGTFGGLSFGPFTQQLSRTLPSGRTEWFQYGYQSLSQRKWDSPIAGEPDLITNLTYDPSCGSSVINYVLCDKPLTITDPKGNTTTYTYATHGGVATETLPAVGGVSPQKRHTYGQFYAYYKNSGGGLVQAATPVWLVTEISECRIGSSCAGTADEIKTSFAYGSAWTANNLLPTSQSVTAFDATVNAIVTRSTSWTYDSNGDKLTEDGPTAGTNDTTRWRYDAMRRVRGVISPDPDGPGGNPHPAVRNTYDPAGRLTKVEKGTVASQSDGDWANFATLESVETTYDLLDRKLIEKKVSGGVTYTLTEYSYDLYGRLECTAVRMNLVGTGNACTHAAAGVHGPDRITRNYYDLAGQLKKVQQGVGTSVQVDYARYEYTANGQQSAVIDANGNRAEFAYDGHDRRRKWTFPHKTLIGQLDTSDYEEYGYDLNSNRTSLRKRDGRTIAFDYDALNRVSRKYYPSGGAREVHYAYNLQGLQTEARFDAPWGGDAVLSSWDGFGQQTASTTAMLGLSRSMGYRYNMSGSRVGVIWPDGQHVEYHRDGLERLGHTQFNGTGYPLFHTPYDAAGRTALLYRWSYSSWNWTFGTPYTWDQVSRLSGYSHNFSSGGNVTTGFTYNPASQVTSIDRSNDDFRFNGQLNLNHAYARNGLNQYSSVGANPYTYDLNGNLTSDGPTGYGYDIENRLVSSTAGAGLTYDPLGRLWRVTGPSSDTRFLYDGDALVAEYDAAGNMLKRYVHGPAEGVDDPMVEFIGSSTASPRYLFADHQGSVVAISDANGNRIAVNAYDEYGVPNGRSGGPTNTGRFQYTGQAWIPELGMYHYKARIYSPTIGRFMQTDPIGYNDQVSLYAYVGNDPVNNVDPDGNQTVPGATIPDRKNWGKILGDAWREIKADPGILLDGAMILVDVATVPSGEAAAGIAVRRGAMEAAEAATPRVVRELPKPPTGPGSVPRADRDPRRTWSSSERAAQREAQQNQCANGCGTAIDATNSNGHHVTRHADGGRTDQSNHAEVCLDCHRKLHSPE